MKIYISGICGTGMGPLALMAKAAGHEVFGSDLAEGMVAPELSAAGVEFVTGPQDGKFLEAQIANGGIDWFVYTSALPEDSAELAVARRAGLRCSKRDELIAFLVDALGLKLVAVAGTHGKTTTTAMIIWACQQMGVPAAYLVGTTLPFAVSGSYQPGDRYLIYEADEYDRNFLHFQPWLSVITTVSYDHPDIYPTPEDYAFAFETFERQSEQVIYGGEVNGLVSMAGLLRREDATSALAAMRTILPDANKFTSDVKIAEVLNAFPGVGRRFERIAPGVYSDYAHHPEEIAATIEMASEEAELRGLTGVVAVYEPHQNTRQHQVFNDYASVFEGVTHLYWLPTYLTREDPNLAVISPAEFIASLSNADVAEAAECNATLAEKLKKWQADGYLILLMTAGPADAWLRGVFK
ncbi:hypothetical protein IJH97_00425 [Candidatus Saccharibacteria bacterium]|nr:hypothetical protein [Candidatus Saccharibacteria bacterium]